MNGVLSSVYDIRHLDDLSRKDTVIHRLHPVTKLLTVLLYLVMVLSFGRYEISSVMPFIFFPVVVLSLAELPFGPIVKRILLVEPLIIGIGILNPLFDHKMLTFGEVYISRGWITFLSIFIKCGLTVAAGLLLVSTTGLDKLGAALRTLGVPKLFVLQLILTYRYISVLMEELSRMLTAYSLRAPGQKGLKWNSWGPFIGQLLLRTLERAQRVYQAMNLRGFTGEYNTGSIARLTIGDGIFLLGWGLFFILARLYNIPLLIGQIFTGA